MSIWLNEESKILIQGITGKNGQFHTEHMLDYGTNIVAGVTPGKGGSDVFGVPVFNTISDAKTLGANVSCIFVPPAFAYSAIKESIDSDIELIIVITEGIPALDMVKLKDYSKDKDVRIIGPNCPGIITPGVGKVGIMPGHIHKKGRIGIVSRSGTLTYEAVNQVSEIGLGQSTCLGIGGDPVIGTTFIDCLEAFENDSETDAIIMIGEIGGNAEEKASSYVKSSVTKPIVGFIAGRTAPPGKRMGHAGAIISGGMGTADAKVEAMRGAGIHVAENPALIGETLSKILN
ncbi:MAG: succinate--CoA ligase subunit alpha [Marine Group III euryarchaeote CG-Bathy1]|uniref:Succinate--CoA ligase [ADP-forming] subunit alpha n=1 Tax=Marine Group III euryarchaeote CG-Bathy1 TaxID=1889001 RepID=A0A1J5TN80_9ARCH|nr:MAG: succinate--CoA ligase subunit alpha [Marine Group III euryarchaeote CG-Bathy1]